MKLTSSALNLNLEAPIGHGLILSSLESEHSEESYRGILSILLSDFIE